MLSTVYKVTLMERYLESQDPVFYQPGVVNHQVENVTNTNTTGKLQSRNSNVNFTLKYSEKNISQIDI